LWLRQSLEAVFFTMSGFKLNMPREKARRSTVSGNTAGVSVGGIFNNGGTLTLTDSRVIGNRPDNCVGC